MRTIPTAMELLPHKLNGREGIKCNLRVDIHCYAKNNAEKQKKKHSVPKAYTNMWNPRQLEKDERSNHTHKTITTQEMSHQSITSREMRRQLYGNKREAMPQLNSIKQRKRKRNNAMQRDNSVVERDEPKEQASSARNIPELLSDGRDNNSAALVTEAERTVEVRRDNTGSKGDVSTLTGSSRGSSSGREGIPRSTINSWETQKHNVKSRIHDEITREWIPGYKFNDPKLAGEIIEPLLSSPGPGLPPPITIGPGMSKEHIVRMALREIITPKFNEWRRNAQTQMRLAYISKWPPIDNL